MQNTLHIQHEVMRLGYTKYNIAMVEQHSHLLLGFRHRRAPLLQERTQEKIRARGMLKVLSTESYRTDTVV